MIFAANNITAIAVVAADNFNDLAPIESKARSKLFIEWVISHLNFLQVIFNIFSGTKQFTICLSNPSG